MIPYVVIDIPTTLFPFYQMRKTSEYFQHDCKVLSALIGFIKVLLNLFCTGYFNEYQFNVFHKFIDAINSFKSDVISMLIIVD